MTGQPITLSNDAARAIARQDPAIYNAGLAPVQGVTPQSLRMRFRESRAWQHEMLGDGQFSVPDLQGEMQAESPAPATASTAASRAGMPAKPACQAACQPAYQSAYKPAAVLIPLVQRAALTLLLTQRPLHMKHHPGQISFPGGRVEASDIDAAATALRETEEEIGLAREHIEIIGMLPAYHTVTHYAVTPVVALVRPPFELTLDANEVADAFEVPLDFILDPANHEKRSRAWFGRERHFYAMPYEDKFIWGATAAMLRNLYHFLRAV